MIIDNKKVFVIAEIGINHNGNLDLAKNLVEAAKACNVNAVKFQTYKAEEVMTDYTPLADYMKGDSKNFLELAKKNQLSFPQTLEIKKYCDEINIEFISSPFDVESCKFLGTLGIRRLKIPSGEGVNPFLLEEAAKTKLPIILSTGMCNLEEVSESINYLKSHNSGQISILHCTTQYPADFKNCNINAIKTLSEKFRLPVGYSDHTIGIEASLAAVSIGAKIIEKHFTLDKSMEGPDHKASMEPFEMDQLVKSIRNLEVAMGDGIKFPFPEEMEIAKIARKSIIANHDLEINTVLEKWHINAKRPGTGIPAMRFSEIIGKKIKKSIKKDELILFSDLKD